VTRITAQKLTREAFAPFGDVIDMGGGNHYPINGGKAERYHDLATAEANQLRFEEGEDIFSRYLPWAIIFELADRWAEICADLVRMGRLPDVVPYWYVGNYHMSNFNTGFVASSLATAATPVASSGSSGSGFGGGSSFSGGGFSGGGGGGGGSSSW